MAFDDDSGLSRGYPQTGGATAMKTHVRCGTPFAVVDREARSGQTLAYDAHGMPSGRGQRHGIGVKKKSPGIWLLFREQPIGARSARNHQGKGNVLLFPRATAWQRDGPVRCRKRLGGLLRYYHREAT